MRIKIYYWQAADRIVAITRRGMINILSEKPWLSGPWIGRNITFEVERSPSRLPKTLVYLGEL